MEMGTGGKAITKHKWLGATTQSEARQVVLAKRKEKEAEEMRLSKKGNTPSKGKKKTPSKKTVGKERGNEVGGVQSRLVDEPTDNEEEEMDVASPSKMKRVVKKKALDKVKRRIEVESEEEEDEENDEEEEMEDAMREKRSKHSEEQTEDIDPTSMVDDVLLDIEFQQLVDRFNNWRRIRLQLQLVLSAPIDWEVEEQWVVEWTESQDIHALTRSWYIEANGNKLKKKLAAKLKARKKGKATTDFEVHSATIPIATVVTQTEVEKERNYVVHIAAHHDLTMHIPNPTLIEETFIQVVVDESLQTLAAENRRRENSEEEGDDEP